MPLYVVYVRPSQVLERRCIALEEPVQEPINYREIDYKVGRRIEEFRNWGLLSAESPREAEILALKAGFAVRPNPRHVPSGIAFYSFAKT